MRHSLHFNHLKHKMIYKVLKLGGSKTKTSDALLPTIYNMK